MPGRRRQVRCVSCSPAEPPHSDRPGAQWHRLSRAAPGAEAAFLLCALSQVTPVQATGINLYDVREKCKVRDRAPPRPMRARGPAAAPLGPVSAARGAQVPPLCYDFSLTEKFLRDPKTTDALGTTGHEWSSCNMKV